MKIDICDLGYQLTLRGQITKDDDKPQDSFRGCIVIEPYADSHFVANSTFSIDMGPSMFGNQNTDHLPCYSMDLTKEQATALLEHLQYWLNEKLPRSSQSPNS